ncbi:kinesin-like protein Klp68D [Haematococcus lacustris]|uniref:Kinesin-like protein Klp68D n=1 Tax=Haematococcus lacustris TaxID=44745 RepID=A0A699Z3A1_HAELA|nr:kinesin-like protein Klp68D [Haematococcus lacustris]
MIALTARLNERDEQIMALQEELEAFDRYQRQLEDALDNKTAELFSLRKEVALRSSSDKHMQGNGSSSNSLVALGATEVERMASMTLSTTPSMPVAPSSLAPLCLLPCC